MGTPNIPSSSTATSNAVKILSSWDFPRSAHQAIESGSGVCPDFSNGSGTADIGKVTAYTKAKSGKVNLCGKSASKASLPRSPKWRRCLERCRLCNDGVCSNNVSAPATICNSLHHWCGLCDLDDIPEVDCLEACRTLPRKCECRIGERRRRSMWLLERRWRSTFGRTDPATIPTDAASVLPDLPDLPCQCLL